MRLQLMMEAIGNIESFMIKTDSYDSFSSNRLLCHAVLYNLQCIGENVYKLSRNYITEHPEMDWAAIEGLRHVLVHDYFNVNLKTVWVILQDDIPKLKHYLNNTKV